MLTTPRRRLEGKQRVGPGVVPGKHAKADADPTSVVEPPSFIEPSFDLRNVRKVLSDPEVGDAHKQKVLMGIHVKFWHASAADMKSMLWRANYDNTVLALVDYVVKACKECSDFARAMPKPMIEKKN